jgi:hypothetical protein
MLGRWPERMGPSGLEAPLAEPEASIIDRSVANEPPPQSIYETGGHELRRWQGCINYAAVNRSRRGGSIGQL